MAMKENNFNFNITLEKIKSGNNKPIYISLIHPNPNVNGERTLYFTYCPIHYINTWGYSISEEAINAWKEGQVTNEKKMVKEMW